MKKIGLGDVAYYLFRPVVYVIDWVWGTDLKDCSVCKARRARWNKFGVLDARLAGVAVAVIALYFVL